ncbi:MAG: non-heme ferritin [Schleiferiaceae bacterium]
MLLETIQNALNTQLKIELESSHTYLAMASWAENQGYPGTAEFLYRHSDEERQHMLKLVRYINERGGVASIPNIDLPPIKIDGLTALFQKLLDHEVAVTQSINEVVDQTLQAKDYSTHNFMQWYVAEQLEEEALAREIMDRLNLIGNDKGGLYLFDRDISTFEGTAPATQQ